MSNRMILKNKNTMKKNILAIVFMFGLVLGANAQRDGFFGGYTVTDFERETAQANIGMPQLPIGSTQNESAPLGSGLLIISILGAGYATAKIRKS